MPSSPRSQRAAGFHTTGWELYLAGEREPVAWVARIIADELGDDWQAHTADKRKAA